MKIQKRLTIASIGIIILGLSLMFIPTEIEVTLIGVVLLMVGMLLFFILLVAKGQP